MIISSLQSRHLKSENVEGAFLTRKLKLERVLLIKKLDQRYSCGWLIQTYQLITY